MATPTEMDFRVVKKIVRYLRGTTGVGPEMSLHPVAPPQEILMTVDVSWAAGPERQSTSGGMVSWLGYQLQARCRTQQTVAQSSAEAELVAMNMGAVEALFVVHLLQEIEKDASVVVSSDSRAAIGICSRTGVGRVKHLTVKQLFLQDEVRSGRMQVRKIDGDTNPADLLTKAVSVDRLCMLMSLVGLREFAESEAERLQLGG